MPRNLCRSYAFFFSTKEDSMAIQESTGSLIGSDKVEGTAVYGANNEKIGSIERVMIEKTTGQVSYAVLSFGGFFGLGDDHYPVPWNLLKYDTELGGYRTDISGNRMKGAPKHGTETVWDWSAAGSKEVDDYYSDGRGIGA
jgi:sporulation protein YlmC with PRC-barrel domain